MVELLLHKTIQWQLTAYGQLYDLGLGVPQDVTKALSYIHALRDLGHARAMWHLNHVWGRTNW